MGDDAPPETRLRPCGSCKRWRWLYLSTVLDDYSVYVIGWKLCKTMKACDVADAPERALAASGLVDGQISTAAIVRQRLELHRY